eukprot:jgi/Mesvir1/21310/Mv25586-RA.1
MLPLGANSLLPQSRGVVVFNCPFGIVLHLNFSKSRRGLSLPYPLPVEHSLNVPALRRLALFAVGPSIPREHRVPARTAVQAAALRTRATRGVYLQSVGQRA